MTDPFYGILTEQYRRESRERMLVTLPKGFYRDCAAYLDGLSEDAVSMRDSGMTDAEVYDEVRERLMSANRVLADLRRIRMEKVSRMAMYAASGGIPDTSPLTSDELELFESYTDSSRRHLGRVVG